MNAPTFISRRQLMQQMTAIALGTLAAPAISFAKEPTNKKPGYGDPSPIYIAPGEGPKGKIGDMDVVFKLNKQQTGAHLGLWETVIQPGELGAPPHYHSSFDEICSVKEGSIFILCGDDVTEVKAGGWHLRPKGLVHTFWNSGDTPATTIDICIPGGHEDYMVELAAMFDNNGRPKPGDLSRLSEKHDIHFRFDLLDPIMKKYKVKL